MLIDGIKKTSHERADIKKNNQAETFLLPDDFNIENPQPDIIIVGKKRSKKHSSFGSPVGLKKSKKKKNNKKLWLRLFIIFVSLLIISLLLIKAYRAKQEISTLSKSAQGHLVSAAYFIDQGDLSSSVKEADLARDEIGKVKFLAQAWGQDIRFLRVISSDSKMVANEQLLDATFLIVKTLNDIQKELGALGVGDDKAEAIPGEKFIYNLAQSKIVLERFSDSGIKNLEGSKKNLNQALPRLDRNYRDQTENAIKTIDKTIASLNSIKAITSNDLPWLSGMDGSTKNIMVLLQNNAELRGGSGGSLGSFGIAKFTDGKLKSIDFAKNIYKIDQAFEQKNDFVEVPEELKWLRCNGGCTWTLKDSGWAVDGVEASKKIMWFYEKETGQRVDGVIMIDTTAIVDLLSELGPIEMSAYQKTITSENFREEVEYEVHKGYFERAGGKEENEPKKILSDMMPIFLDRTFTGLKDGEKALRIFGTLLNSLKRKDITLYFDNENFQNKINDMNYSGIVSPAPGDYLYVNNSNIAGEKSSLSVKQNIELKVTISDSVPTENNLSLTRIHTGSGVWPDGINKNFTRLLLPEKSEVVSFKPISGSYEKFYDKGSLENNFYTSDLYGKKNVNFWMSTKPGNKSKLVIDYKTGYIPLRGEKEFTYVLNLQKQPGGTNDQVSLSIAYPSEYIPLNVKNFSENTNIIELKFNLTSDHLVKVKFAKKE